MSAHVLPQLSLDTIRACIAEAEMARFQDPKIEVRRDVKRPYYRIRPVVPVRDAATGMIVRRQKEHILGYLDEISVSEARMRKQEHMAAVNQGKVLVQAHIPFRVIVQKFLEARVPQLGTATQAKYRSHIENHILSDMGELRICDIDQPTVETWLNNKREKDGLSWWTRTDLRNLLSAIFTKALDWKLWNGENPCERVQIGGKAEKREKRLLSESSFARYLAALEASQTLVEGVSGHAVRLMVLVAYVTGLRISEVLGLQPADVDIPRRTLEVKRRWHRGDVAQPKSPRSKRTRQLGAELAGELELWITAHPGTWVFQGSEGNPPDDRNLNQHILRPLAVELGLYWEGFGFHVFRRQNISWRQEAGASSLEAQIAAGHARASQTFDYMVIDATREKAQAEALYRRAMGKKSKVLKMKGTSPY